MAPLCKILDRLDGVTGGADGQHRRCPAHQDRQASLSIREAEDGRVLLNCHAGCTVEAIVKAIGLTLAELFPAPNGEVGRVGHNGTADSRKAALPKGKVYCNFKEALASLDVLMHGKQQGHRAGSWTYRDASGQPIAKVLRYDLPSPDGEKAAKTFRPISRHLDGWRLCDPPGKWPLYRVNELAGAERVFVVEGEKCADAVAELGLAATTSAHGAKSSAKTDWSPLAGRKVVLLPDNDDAGRKYTAKVTEILTRLECPATVGVIDLTFPGRRKGDDVVEWAGYHRGRGRSDRWLARRLGKLADQAAPLDLTERGDGGDVHGDGGEGDDDAQQEQPEGKKDVQVVKLLSLVKDMELFRKPGGADVETFASFLVRGHRETWPVRSQGLKLWLISEYYRVYERPPGTQALHEAVAALEAKAFVDGPALPTAVRLAEHEGAVYLDLADDQWRAVRIGPDGWNIVAEPPIRFLRRKGMLPLPARVRGGALSELRQLVNIQADGDWALFLTWLVAALRPGRPCPLLAIGGEQGSAKSTLCRVGRSLIDPNVADLRRPPREERDLMIAAKNSWLVAFENVSFIAEDLSDGLCCLITGGAMGKRQLYTDDDEALFCAMRPVLINGITDVVVRPDLLDRSIILTLSEITDATRISEAELEVRLNAARPRILGALLDAVSAGMKALPGVRLPELPRMADFMLWGTACEAALGLEEGTFARAYARNRDEAAEIALDGSVVARHLLALPLDRGPWEGTTGELHAYLEEQSSAAERQNRLWPKSPRALAGAIRRLRPNLRAVGVQVEHWRRAGGSRDRMLTITRGEPNRTEDKADAEKEASATNRPNRPDRPKPQKNQGFRTDQPSRQPSRNGDPSSRKPVAGDDRDDRDGGQGLNSRHTPAANGKAGTVAAKTGTVGGTVADSKNTEKQGKRDDGDRWDGKLPTSLHASVEEL